MYATCCSCVVCIDLILPTCSYVPVPVLDLSSFFLTSATNKTLIKLNCCTVTYVAKSRQRIGVGLHDVSPSQ